MMANFLLLSPVFSPVIQKRLAMLESPTPLEMPLIIFALQHQEGVPHLCQRSKGNLIQTSEGHPGQGKANENNDSLDPSQDSQHPKVFHTVLKTPCTGLKSCRPRQTPTCLCGKLYVPKA